MVIAVDFDGTCVTHEYPKVGKNIGASPVLRQLVKEGHKIILFTMRCNPEGDLKDALDWFKKENIPLFGINENPTQTWSYSPKAYAHLYIDDAGIGCPLIKNIKLSERPFVAWIPIMEKLENLGFFETITQKEREDIIQKIYKEIYV